MRRLLVTVLACAALGTAPHQVSHTPAAGVRQPLRQAQDERADERWAKGAAGSIEPFDADPIDCTFAHPRYAGECVEKVDPAGKQTPVQACRVILDCLNDTRCVKTYCRATTIRGGWSLVSPKPKDH